MRATVLTLAVLALSTFAWAAESPEAVPSVDAPEVAALDLEPSDELLPEGDPSDPIFTGVPPCRVINGVQCSNPGQTTYCYWHPGTYLGDGYCICTFEGTWDCGDDPDDPF